jgi:hypothetical protein
LRVGTATVKNHVHTILTKLQVRSRGEVAAWIRRANARTLGKTVLNLATGTAWRIGYGRRHRSKTSEHRRFRRTIIGAVALDGRHRHRRVKQFCLFNRANSLLNVR